MSSWVAPSIAAELWGMSLEQIMSGIADGSIPSRMEGHFLFVAMGGALSHSTPAAAVPQNIITEEEQAALKEIHINEESATETDLSDWRLKRYQSSLKRRPPIAA